MNWTKLLACFAFLTCLYLVNSRVYNGHKEEIKQEDAFNNLVAIRDVTSHDLHKRGVGGIIAMITLSTLTLASSGMRLWTALTEGCNVQPSICTNKDRIKEIEDELDTLSTEYEEIYYANQWKYLNLKESMINNEYVLHYINDTVRAVEDIGDSIDIITTKLEVDLRTMEKMYANSSDSATLESLVGPFDYQLAEIQKMIDQLKKSQIIGLVVQRASEVIINKFSNYVDKVVTKAKLLDVGDSTINRIISATSDLPEAQRTYWQRAKTYFSTKTSNIGFAMKAVGLDVKTKFGTSLPNNVKKWWAAGKSWSTFKTQFKSSFLSDTSTIGRVKNFFKNPTTNIKYAVKNFKFSGGMAFLQVIGLTVDAIQQYIDIKNWQKVAEDIELARTKYEEYLANVKIGIEEVKNETVQLGNYWSDTISSFETLVDNFNNITQSARDNEVFAEVFGLSGIPVDTSHEFFSTDFTSITEKELKPKQQVVISFMNANGESLSALQDKFKVQEILVSETKDQIALDFTINAIFLSLQRIYRNFQSSIIQAASSQLLERDVVCMAAYVLPDENVYDYFPLTDFRTAKCNITNDTFTSLLQEAAEKRDMEILNQIINDNVPLKKKPSIILDLAKAGYSSSSNSRLQDFGSKLVEQDIVCNIAILFPDLNEYMLYDLTLFRPDCSQVTPTDFATMQADVVKMENARSMINFSMQFCVQFNQCNCPSVLAGMAGLTVSQINMLIEEYKQENKPDCNYVEQNGVCSWQC